MLTAARSPPAERMRLHRQRRRVGLRCIVVGLRATEIDELIRRGLLSYHARDDPLAMRHVLYGNLDKALSP